MKKIVGMSVVVLLVALAANYVIAQPTQQPGGRGGAGQRGFGAGGIQFLLGEEGRKDLGITDEQVTKIREAQRGNMPADIQSMSQDERRTAMEKAMTETTKKIEAVFTKEQLEKVQARSFQFVGIAGLGNNPFAQAALKLTDEQKTKIREIQREQRQAGGDRPNFQDMAPEERQKAMRARAEETRKKLEEKISGVLNDRQKKIAEKLTGDTPAYIKTALERRNSGEGAPRREGADRRREN